MAASPIRTSAQLCVGDGSTLAIAGRCLLGAAHLRSPSPGLARRAADGGGIRTDFVGADGWRDDTFMAAVAVHDVGLIRLHPASFGPRSLRRRHGGHRLFDANHRAVVRGAGPSVLIVADGRRAERGRRAKVGGSMALLVCGMGVGWLAFHPLAVLSAPMYQEDSPYQQVRVREDDLFRYLILDRTFHAVMWKADPIELYLPYSQLMMAALAVHAAPQRALILGHGGGSLAKWLGAHWPELEVDTVEVDPLVVRAAERYFDYHPRATHHVHVADARTFLRTTQTRYDIIWLDVFARHLIPFHLTTQEFFQELRTHLTHDGILAVNLASSGEGPDRQRASAVVATLSTVFPLIESFGVKGPWRTSNQPQAENLIFFVGPSVARMTTPVFLERISELIAQRRLPAQVPSLMIARPISDWSGGFVLTDDYAPYDLLIGREKSDAAPSR